MEQLEEDEWFYETMINKIIGKLIKDKIIKARLDTNYGDYECKLQNEESCHETPCLYIILPNLKGIKIDRKDMRVYLELNEEWLYV